jgi:GTP cyclohydrolase II
MSKILSAAAVIGLLAVSPAYAQMAFHYNGPNETPEQNQIRAARYERLLQTNPSFRAYRMHRECSPIDFIQSLRQDCLASFDQFEPVLYR